MVPTLLTALSLSLSCRNPYIPPVVDSGDTQDSGASLDSAAPSGDSQAPVEETGSTPGEDSEGASSLDSGDSPDSSPPKPEPYVVPDGFVQISAGSFEMGCTEAQREHGACEEMEYPVHRVTLTRDFVMGLTEVTQAQYQSLMGDSPSTFSSCGGDCPVETVSWHQAAAYANALSAQDGWESCYQCSGSGVGTSCAGPKDPYACEGYRLPTEAEWEFAARCGQDSLYAGSSDPDAVAWHSYRGGSSTSPVAGLSPNACGLYDMSGNVFEHIEDWYTGSAYPTEYEEEDPFNAVPTEYHLARGGSWNLNSDYLRVSYRGGFEPGVGDKILGFRLVQTVPEAP